MNKKKQAVLIMCHNDFYILEKSLELLDNEKFDFYIHVDIKSSDFDFEKIKGIIKKGKIFFTERNNVIWGDYSQIETELLLLKTALRNDEYLYLHLISGSDLPIKKSNDILTYFYNNYPMEFIGYNSFNSIEKHMADRVRYFYFLDSDYRTNENEKILLANSLKLQQKVGVDRLKNVDLEFRVGSNWFSITSDLAKYVISKEEMIKNIFSYGYCADELFLQTIVYNSSFFANVCKEYDDDNENCKRLIDWKKGSPYIFKKDDFNFIISSSTIFARKFSTTIDKEIIDLIYNYLKEK